MFTLLDALAGGDCFGGPRGETLVPRHCINPLLRRFGPPGRCEFDRGRRVAVHPRVHTFLGTARVGAAVSAVEARRDVGAKARAAELTESAAVGWLGHAAAERLRWRLCWRLRWTRGRGWGRWRLRRRWCRRGADPSAAGAAAGTRRCCFTALLLARFNALVFDGSFAPISAGIAHWESRGGGDSRRLTAFLGASVAAGPA